MEHEPYHILWVSSTPSVPAVVQQVTSRQTAPAFQLSQAAPYYPAIQAVEYSSPDAVLVLADFPVLDVLEFIHHTRLVNSQMPIMILCEEYDAALHYKSRKLGATDCVTMAEVDGQLLGGLLKKGQKSSPKARQSPRMGKSILQIPVWFK